MERREAPVMSLVNVSATPVQVDRERVLQALRLNPEDPKTQALLLVCERYGLDPLLKHMVLIGGNPYVTRDGLLHVAHSSGKFDGVEVVAEGESPNGWWAQVSVWRKDMSRPFSYRGRYPRSGDNAKYGPEMAVKCAEVAALRRAFDVSGLPAADELHSVSDYGGVAGPDENSALHDQRARINELSAQLDTEGKALARAWVDEHGIDMRRMSCTEADGVILMLDGLVNSVGPPVEVVGGAPMPAHLNRRLMAVAAERLVPPGDLAGEDKESWRRDALLGLAAELGYPGLTSRRQIGDELADRLLARLEELPLSEG
jgi:hypothetical protein